MIVSIHQPYYWPWLGLLDKIAKSDCYIILDDVPANKEANQYRNFFFCNGTQKNLTLPVDYKMGKKIIELKFNNDKWRDDHLNKLKNYYQKAKFINEIMPSVEKLYDDYDSQYAVDFIIETIKFSCAILNINVQMLRSSNLDVDGLKGDKVVDLCRKVSASTYLSGRGAANYMDEDILKKFREEAISIKWQYFSHPVYRQTKKFPFVKGLSCLDLFFFQGIENSRKIFWDNINENKPFE